MAGSASSGVPPSKSKELFNAYDTDHDGRLDLPELTRREEAKRSTATQLEAIDKDGDGVVTEEEFINGCLKDQAFVMLLEKFSGDTIWGL